MSSNLVLFIASFTNTAYIAWYKTTKDGLLQLMTHSQEMTTGLKFKAAFFMYLKYKYFVTF